LNRLLVLGASGAVGGFLLSRLDAAGVAVLAASRQLAARPPEPSPMCQWQALDLWRDQFCVAATEIISVGPVDGLVAWLARGAAPELRRIVALSSMSIVAKRDSADAAERALAASLAQSETALVEHCTARGIAYTILRPTLIWGSGRDHSVSRLFRLARRCRIVPLPWSIGGLRQPVHADDVAAACQLALGHAECAGATFALGGAEVLPVGALYARVIRAANALPLPLPGLLAVQRLAGRRRSGLSATLARWSQDQLAPAESSFPDWPARGFAPVAADF
jgi:nucleoside-diphosphate-sugar epimerase